MAIYQSAKHIYISPGVLHFCGKKYNKADALDIASLGCLDPSIKMPLYGSLYIVCYDKM